MFKHKNRWYLFLIILMTLVLGLLNLSLNTSYIFDETTSYQYATLTFSKFIHYSIYENNPPLFNFILSLWIKVFGYSEFVTRLLPLIIGLISIYYLYFLGKKMFSERVGLMAAFIAGGSNVAMGYFTQLRQYSLYFLLSILSVYLFWQIIESVRPRSWRWWYFIVNLCLVYTHIFGWFLILVEMIFLLYLKFRRPNLLPIKLRQFFFGHLVVVAFFLIWFLLSLFSKASVDLSKSWYFISLAGSWLYQVGTWIIIVIFFFLPSFFVSFKTWTPIYSIMISLILFFILLIFVDRADKKTYFISPRALSDKSVFLLIWLVAPVIISIIIKIVEPKFYLFLAPNLFLLTAISWEKLRQSFSVKLSTVVALLLGLSLIGSVANELFSVNYSRPWPTVGRYLEDNADNSQAIILFPFLNKIMMDRYYSGRLPIIEFAPGFNESDPFVKVMANNWRSYLNRDNINNLNQLLNSYQKVYWVTNSLDFQDPQRIFLRWFDEHGWMPGVLKYDGWIKIYFFSKK